MKNDRGVSENEGSEEGLRYFLKSLGEYIRIKRENAGFDNASEFALLVDIAESQYREYERGETDMRISSLLKIFKGLNLNKEDIFAFNIFTKGNDIQEDNLGAENLEAQVRRQVSAVRDSGYEQNLTSSEIKRIVKILIYAVKPRTKLEITKHLGLAGKTNNFQSIFKLLLSSGWIAMSSPDKPNTPRQRYYCTETGKKLIRII